MLSLLVLLGLTKTKKNIKTINKQNNLTRNVDSREIKEKIQYMLTKQ